MLSTFRALKPSESDSKAQFLKCLSHLRKALASCDHDCYVIRSERLHASACPPLVTANCDLLVADLIYNLCTQEKISSILSDALAPLRRVVVLFRYSTQKTEVSFELHTIPLLSID